MDAYDLITSGVQLRKLITKYVEPIYNKRELNYSQGDYAKKTHIQVTYIQVIRSPVRKGTYKNDGG